MNLITIILFFIYSWGFGLAATFFIKDSKNVLEKNLMRIGIGLGVFVVISTLFAVLHIPLDWKIFLLLSLIAPAFVSLKKFQSKTFSLPKLTKANLNILIVLILFSFTFFMYHKGAFIYPYLEDGDPWGHADSIKYISLEKTALEPFSGKSVFQYIDAYPPGYDILMAILHQTSPSINWTIKFFNSLIISLGIIFFYFFAKELMNNKNKALFATFVLAMVPCYMSHFIWSHSLAVALIFPLFYCIRKIQINKKWIYPSILIFGSLALIQMTQSIKIFILVLIYLFVVSLKEKKLNKEICIVIIGGMLLWAVWWGPMVLKYKGDLLTEGLTQGTKSFLGPRWKDYGIKYIGPLGTATRIYTFKDFFVAQHQNMINNPVGVGIVLSLLLLISLIPLALNRKKLLKDRNDWKLTAFLWLAFAFLGIHGGTRVPIALYSFRFWMLFAIFLSLLVGEGLWFLFGFVGRNKILKIGILVIVIIGIWFTSGAQKYSVNTAMWPPGGEWGSNEVLGGYIWMKENLPVNTKVVPMTSASGHIIGLDMFTCVWCEEEQEFYKTNINKSANEIHNWVKKNKYDYALFDMSYIEKFGINETQIKINSLLESNGFDVAYQDKGFVLLRVR